MIECIYCKSPLPTTEEKTYLELQDGLILTCYECGKITPYQHTREKRGNGTWKGGKYVMS